MIRLNNIKIRENISDITFNHKIRLFNWFIVRDRKINYLEKT